MQQPTYHDSRSASESGTRFQFGANWAAFLAHADRSHIDRAKDSLRQFLGIESLAGRSFLDVGSGSGLFSLAAYELGATVSSFDFDLQSVACTQELKRRYAGNDARWTVQQGSILDAEFVAKLERFDVVYSWGVLHHTGDLWQACEKVASLVNPNGLLLIAIYNDQGFASRCWTIVKRGYNVLPRALRFAILWPAFLRIWGPTMVKDLARARPFQTWRQYPAESRGMNPWHDVIDWVGGYPFEVATPEQVRDFFCQHGFEPVRDKLCGGGRGCNEFLFRRAGE